MPATERVTQWLKAFDVALKAKDVLAAINLFNEDCYWRDLVSVTWNIKTCEGR